MKQHYTILVTRLIVLIGIVAIPTIAHAQIQLGNTILADEKYDGTGDAVAMSGDATRIIVGASRATINGNEDAGEASVYAFQSGNWVQLGSTITGGDEDEELGTSVDISEDGNRIVVASELGVRVYDFQNGDWQLVADYNIFSEFDENEGGAERVDLVSNGGILFIGNEILIAYEETNGNWTQKGRTLDLNTSATYFAASKAGNRVAVPSEFDVRVTPSIFGTYEDINIFDFENNDWVRKQTISIADSAEIVATGERALNLSSAIDFSANANRLVFIASNDERVDEEGFIFTYELQNGTWEELIDSVKILIDNPFGTTLKLSDDGKLAAIGVVDDVWFEQPNYVAMYQFKNDNWEMLGVRFTGSGSDEFANSFVDISNDGTKMVWGGKVNNEQDSLGFIQVYNYSPIVSVFNSTLNKEIKVYPNPAHDFIHVLIDDEEMYNLVLFDATGKQIQSIFNQNEITKVALNNVETGVYFLNIYDEANRQIATSKIVKLE